MGLRVRWEWPELLARQAPDVREFRIYVQPGRLNAFAGRVVALETTVRRAESVVTIEAGARGRGPSSPGTVLQVAGHAYAYSPRSGLAGSTLRVRGARATGPCTLLLPEGHPSWTDPRAAATWAERWHIVAVDEHHTAGAGANGRPVRRYEVLLPAPGDTHRGGIETVLSPDRREPVAVAAVGVSAADDRDEVPDAPEHAGGRWPDTGNEGAVGPPATVVRVLRAPPPPPRAAPDGERRSPARTTAATPSTLCAGIPRTDSRRTCIGRSTTPSSPRTVRSGSTSRERRGPTSRSSTRRRAQFPDPWRSRDGTPASGRRSPRS